MQHQLFLLASHNKLHLTPIGDDIKNMLDTGTGTGMWVIDFGVTGSNLPILRAESLI